MQGIYEIRNRENDKIYIGSSNNITKRWEQHICNLTYKIHHSYKLQQDWNKYGFDNFEFRIIELVKDKKNLLKIEQKWIDSLDIEESYNVMSYTNYKGISVPTGFIEAASYSESISQDIKNKLKNNIKIFNKKNTFLKMGNGKYDLSKTWMNKNHDEVIRISDNIINYFTNIRHARSTEQAWTTFTTHFSQLKKKGTIKSFVPLTGKLEEHDKRNNLVFAANCFPNSFVKQKINENKTILDDDTYALSILLGWVINVSNINKEIYIYLPSLRMEKLLRSYLNINMPKYPKSILK